MNGEDAKTESAGLHILRANDLAAYIRVFVGGGDLVCVNLCGVFNSILEILHTSLAIFTKGELVRKTGRLELVELPRRNVGFEQLVNLLEIASLELWHTKEGIYRGEEGKASPDVRRTRPDRAQQVWCREDHHKTNDNVQCSLRNMIRIWQDPWLGAEPTEKAMVFSRRAWEPTSAAVM